MNELMLSLLQNVYVLGMDVSRYQGKVDWKMARSNGIEFGAARATVGDFLFDSMFVDNLDGMGENGVRPIAYHVTDPNVPWKSQVDFFLSKVPLSYVRHVIVDNEVQRNKSVDVITSTIRNFSEAVSDKLGKPVIMYTNYYWWTRYVQRWSGWKQYPLHLARYFGGEVPPPGGPWWDGKCKPKDWTTYVLHQFSANGNRLGHKYGASLSWDIDLDAFNGNISDLDAFLGTGTLPGIPLPPPAEVLPGALTVAVPSAYVRSAPYGKVVAGARAGQTYRVLDSAYDNNRKIWYKIDSKPNGYIAGWLVKEIWNG